MVRSVLAALSEWVMYRHIVCSGFGHINIFPSVFKVSTTLHFTSDQQNTSAHLCFFLSQSFFSYNNFDPNYFTLKVGLKYFDTGTSDKLNLQ